MREPERTLFLEAIRAQLATHQGLAAVTSALIAIETIQEKTARVEAVERAVDSIHEACKSIMQSVDRSIKLFEAEDGG